jgi:hypothetical protein
MPVDVEGVVDRRVGGEKSRGRGLGFELLLSLSPEAKAEPKVQPDRLTDYISRKSVAFE